MYIKRDILIELQDLAKYYPVVTLTGPRQSGKTTVLKEAFPDHIYYSLEDPDLRTLALEDPRRFLDTTRGNLILDEIQQAPLLLSYIQTIVDAAQKPGQFILSGSQQFELSQAITQSLSGRTALLKLLPLSFKELQTFKKSTLDEQLLYGFFPRIYNQGLNPTKAYRNYYETYIQRDLRQLIRVKDLHAFQKFVKVCAGRIGQLFVASQVASEIGVSVPTIQSWLSILEMSYIVCLLQPYYANINKRLIKTPKLYFYDVGLAAYLLEIETVEHVSRDPLRGSLFENMVLMELIKSRYNKGMDHCLYFYRDSYQHEVDILFKSGQTLFPIEVKSSETYHSSFCKNLDYLRSVFPQQIDKGSIIYAGDLNQNIKQWTLLNYGYSGDVLDGGPKGPGT